MRISPSVLVVRQINLLLGHLPGVRDADVDHVHDARVATRRIRELLPLVSAESGTSTRQAFELVRDTVVRWGPFAISTSSWRSVISSVIFTHTRPASSP